MGSRNGFRYFSASLVGPVHFSFLLASSSARIASLVRRSRLLGAAGARRAAGVASVVTLGTGARAGCAPATLVTTDAVIVETWLILHRRFHYSAAEGFWGGVRRGGARVEKVTAADFEAAWRIGVEFADQSFSIVDRTSFAGMERLGLTRAASFGRDFAVYRYGGDRSRAFEILR